jgi:glutathione S-transferase
MSRRAAPLVLVSHALCPYVQRAAIVLAEKGVAFERRDVDLAAKPAWFMQVSPLGKTPVLLVGEAPVFESAVICEYLDETHGPRLHPPDALDRARHRGWIEFASALLAAIAAFYNAADDAVLAARAHDIRGRLRTLEAALGEGPWFGGASFSLVDAAFAPAWRYFDAFDSIDAFGFFDAVPKVARWRTDLSQRRSVRQAVRSDYPALLWAFLRARGGALARRMALSVKLEPPPAGGLGEGRALTPQAQESAAQTPTP